MIRREATPELLRIGDEVVVPHNRWDLVDVAGRREPPEVSVVIPYYDAPADLALVLAGLAGQTHPRSRLQVIVADDGSPVPPPAAPPGLDLTVVRQPDDGFRAAAARNLGAAAADGEVLVFLDGDTVPEADFVRRLVALPAALGDALVVGRRRHGDFGGWTAAQVAAWLAGRADPPVVLDEPAWLRDGYQRTVDLRHVDRRSYQLVISAVLACRRALFRELGGFEESFRRYGGEDWELAYRAFNAGAVLAHEPAAVAWHNGPDWAARGGTTADKNIETMTLAHFIPEPSTRGRGVRHRHPDVVVRLDTAATASAWASAPADALVASVCTFLAAEHADIGVHLPRSAGAPGAEAAAGFFAADPRVTCSPPDASRLARCGIVVEVAEPVAVEPTVLDRLAELLEPGGVGRVDVRHGDGAGLPLLTAYSSRAVGRARRWAVRPDKPDEVGGLVDRLFGTVTVAGEQFGVCPLGDEPDLAAILRRSAGDR